MDMIVQQIKMLVKTVSHCKYVCRLGSLYLSSEETILEERWESIVYLSAVALIDMVPHDMWKEPESSIWPWAIIIFAFSSLMNLAQLLAEEHGFI